MGEPQIHCVQAVYAKVSRKPLFIKRHVKSLSIIFKANQGQLISCPITPISSTLGQLGWTRLTGNFKKTWSKASGTGPEVLPPTPHIYTQLRPQRGCFRYIRGLMLIMEDGYGVWISNVSFSIHWYKNLNLFNGHPGVMSVDGWKNICSSKKMVK